MNKATILQQFKRPAQLLSKGETNAKTAKNELSALILYLAPLAQNSQGRNLCPKASATCSASRPKATPKRTAPGLSLLRNGTH